VIRSQCDLPLLPALLLWQSYSTPRSGLLLTCVAASGRKTLAIISSRFAPTFFSAEALGSSAVARLFVFIFNFIPQYLPFTIRVPRAFCRGLFFRLFLPSGFKLASLFRCGRLCQASPHPASDLMNSATTRALSAFTFYLI
jgi:hypothetical protein